METLQQQLRQMRSQQGKTLYQVASLLPGLGTKELAKLEQGERKSLAAHLNGGRGKTAAAYGVAKQEFRRMLEAEWLRRVCGHDGNYTALPHSYLPEVARRFFQDGNFVILDLETTGIDPHAPETEIVDIAILDEDGNPLLSTLVKPERPIPPAASAIHGISEKMVLGSPLFYEIAPQIAAAIENKIVIAYNAGFDIYLIDNLIIGNSLSMPVFDSWCLMLSYADFYKSSGKFGNYAWQRLSRACEQQKVVLNDAHRALGDALATWRLLQALAERKEMTPG